MRKFLGRNATVASREAVFETDEGLEVQSSDQYEVAEKRVLYADVVMVSIHRERGLAFILGCAVGALFFLFPAVMGFLLESPPVGITFSLMALPFAILAILRWILGVDVVTVSGRRSRASLRYGWRKQRARDLYERLRQLVADKQERLAEQYATEAALAPRPETPEAPEAPRPILSNPYGGETP